MSAPVEITSEAVALLKLPIAVKELTSMIKHVENAYGEGLRMAEQPKGWLQFFKPQLESEVGK